MDSGLREILRAHEYNRLNLGCYGCNWSFDDMEDGNSWDQYLAHIESLESQQPKTRGKGMEHFPVPDDDVPFTGKHGRPTRIKQPTAQAELGPDSTQTEYGYTIGHPNVNSPLPPQRPMTPEEVAGMKAYRKTKFKRVPAQADRLREEVPIIHGRAELAAHDAALRAGVREETLDAVIPAIIKWLSENPKWTIMSRLNNSLRKAATAALASEKAAPEERKLP